MIVWGQKVNFGLRVKMAAVAWLSVIAKQGEHVMVPFKVIRCCWDDTFAELLSKAAPEIKKQGNRTNSNIFMVTIVTKCGYHSNQLFLSLLNRPTDPCCG